MKKIDKEKSVVYSQWNNHVLLGIKGTFVNNFDKPEDYYEGTLWNIRTDAENPFMDRYGNGYKYFVPRSTHRIIKTALR